MTWYAAGGKRVVDIALAGMALLVLGPLILLIAVAIRIEDGGPALFRQRRTGRDGQEFTLLKFRSMPVGTADVPSASATALPITRVGRVIRRTNLDELPQLVNILAGDMSVVGPRPALPTQADLIAWRAQSGAWRCRPGLTGLAQVCSYDGMPVSEKAALDGAYAQRLGLLRDLGIIARTVLYVFRRPPVY